MSTALDATIAPLKLELGADKATARAALSPYIVTDAHAPTLGNTVIGGWEMQMHVRLVETRKIVREHRGELAGTIFQRVLDRERVLEALFTPNDRDLTPFAEAYDHFSFESLHAPQSVRHREHSPVTSELGKRIESFAHLCCNLDRRLDTVQQVLWDVLAGERAAVALGLLGLTAHHLPQLTGSIGQITNSVHDTWGVYIDGWALLEDAAKLEHRMHTPSDIGEHYLNACAICDRAADKLAALAPELPRLGASRQTVIELDAVRSVLTERRTYSHLDSNVKNIREHPELENGLEVAALCAQLAEKRGEFLKSLKEQRERTLRECASRSFEALFAEGPGGEFDFRNTVERLTNYELDHLGTTFAHYVPTLRVAGLKFLQNEIPAGDVSSPELKALLGADVDALAPARFWSAVTIHAISLTLAQLAQSAADARRRG